VSIASRTFRLGLLCLVAGALIGCRGERSDKPPRQFFPDLDAQPKYKSQSESTFFADKRSMRRPVQGSVPFGAKPFAVSFNDIDFSKRDSYLRENRSVFDGLEPVLDADGRPVLEADGRPRVMYLERIPIDVTADLLALGEKKFNIFCIVCHGGTGEGKGTVGSRWSYPLPSFHAEQYQRGGEKGQDGYIFHTILNGVPNVGENVPYPLKMPSYRGKISEREAWAIVAYFRALQAAAASPLDAAPERERMELERRRGASAPQADAAGATLGKERGS